MRKPALPHCHPRVHLAPGNDSESENNANEYGCARALRWLYYAVRLYGTDLFDGNLSMPGAWLGLLFWPGISAEI